MIVIKDYYKDVHNYYRYYIYSVRSFSLIVDYFTFSQRFEYVFFSSPPRRRRRRKNFVKDRPTPSRRRRVRNTGPAAHEQPRWTLCRHLWRLVARAVFIAFPMQLPFGRAEGARGSDYIDCASCVPCTQSRAVRCVLRRYRARGEGTRKYNN